MELVYAQLLQTIENEDVKIINPESEMFDPYKHEALMQIENIEVESGIIVEEHLKGYNLNDKVVRHAQVIVSK